MKFEFGTPPLTHQEQDFFRSCDLEAFGVFWDQGLGKSWLMIQNFAYLYEKGEIDAVLIIAPKGAHQNWTYNEIPQHLPKRLKQKTRTHDYHSNKADTKWHQKECRLVLHHDGLAVLSMAYSALMTKGGAAFAKEFLTKRKGVFYIVDEAHRIKEPSTKRTQRVIRSGAMAKYRRILTGTPIANSPFDAYAPIKFLYPKFWKEKQMDNFGAFKNYFGIWEQAIHGREIQQYQNLVAYRNLDKLQAFVQGISSRLEKHMVLDLPPKVYSKWYFEPTPEQKRLYRELREEYMATLSTGEEVDADLAIVRLLRMQQVLCGYLPTADGGEGIHEIPDGNPRMDALIDLCEDLPHSAIIWSRFTHDIEMIADRLGDQCVTYYGKTKNDDRMANVAKFQDRGAKYFVANPQAAGEALTLHAAETVVYYSNSFKLTERLQSEDRAHRIGQTKTVTYLDLMAPKSVDEYVVNCLRSKREIARLVQGDEIREWI